MPWAWRHPAACRPNLLSQPDVPYWYDYRAGQVTSGNAFGTLRPLGGLFGPELSLGRTLADALSEDIVIVKVANSGKRLAQGSGEDWNSASTGEAYDDLIANVLAAQANLMAAGETPRIAGLFWMQGESDGSSGSRTGAAVPPQPETADAYEANLTNFIASVRTDLSVPEMPFFVGKLNLGDDPAFPLPESDFNNRFGEGDFTPVIQAAQEAVADADPNSYLIETDQFGHIGDFVHFDQPGQIGLGEAFAASYLATIPEPSCLILFATGMVAFSGFGRSRHSPNRTISKA